MIDYEKYQNREVKQVDDERLSKIKEIPFHKHLYYKNINRIVTAPELEAMIGFKKYEDGSGISSAYTRIDGATIEMLQWWNIWSRFEPKRYQLLYPNRTIEVSNISKKDEKRFLNKKLPLFERKWESELHLCEKSKVPKWISKLFGMVGDGLGDVSYAFKRPIEIGIDESLFEDQDLKKFVGAISYNALYDFPITIMHYFIEDELGVDVHSRFWLGVRFNGKRFVREGVKKIPTSLLKYTVKNCLEEYTSLSGILKELYDLEKGKINAN